MKIIFIILFNFILLLFFNLSKYINFFIFIINFRSLILLLCIINCKMLKHSMSYWMSKQFIQIIIHIEIIKFKHRLNTLLIIHF